MAETDTESTQERDQTLVGTWMDDELVGMLDTMRGDLNRSQFMRRLVRQEWNRQQGMVVSAVDQRRPTGGPR